MISTKTVLFVLLAMLVAATATLRGERQGLLDLTKINDAHQLHATADDPCAAEMSAREKAKDYTHPDFDSLLYTQRLREKRLFRSQEACHAPGAPGHNALMSESPICTKGKADYDAKKATDYEAANAEYTKGKDEITAINTAQIANKSAKDAAVEAWQGCCQKNKPSVFTLGFSNHKSKGCMDDKTIWKKEEVEACVKKDKAIMDQRRAEELLPCPGEPSGASPRGGRMCGGNHRPFAWGHKFGVCEHTSSSP